MCKVRTSSAITAVHTPSLHLHFLLRTPDSHQHNQGGNSQVHHSVRLHQWFCGHFDHKSMLRMIGD
jgi:hypothetical protein